MITYLQPHIYHRASGDHGGHFADGGLHDDLTQYFVGDYLLHGSGYFVANRLFHKVSVLFGYQSCKRECVFDLQPMVDEN